MPTTPRGGDGRGSRWRWRNVSLLWRVFAVNLAVCVIAFALLAWTPVTVHRVTTPPEMLILSLGLVVMLAVDLVLLSRIFGPLRRLAGVMGSVQPGDPGRRAGPFAGAGPEVQALAVALNSMLDRLEDERRASGRRALAAQEDERARVARELHDEVGQTLTAIALRAERAAGEAPPRDEALAEIAQTALRSLDEVRRIGRELRPEALDDLGLLNALIALCLRVERQGAMRVRRDLQAPLPQLSDEVELVIYRVAQEALTNARRHARASEAQVALLCADDRAVLRVADDGLGLPAQRIESGIAGMRERAMLIGASLAISSTDGKGTEVLLSVPLGPAQR